VIRAEIERQGDHMGIERMCALAGVSRAGYYRYWRASKPRQEETALRDEIQRLSLVRRKNGYRDGYRPITIQLQRMGWAVNHKRVARIRREAGESHLERYRRICDEMTVFGIPKLDHKPRNRTVARPSLLQEIEMQSACAGRTTCFACRRCRSVRRRRTRVTTGMSGPTWRAI
jgi:hypothetical protein